MPSSPAPGDWPAPPPAPAQPGGFDSNVSVTVAGARPGAGEPSAGRRIHAVLPGSAPWNAGTGFAGGVRVSVRAGNAGGSAAPATVCRAGGRDPGVRDPLRAADGGARSAAGTERVHPHDGGCFDPQRQRSRRAGSARVSAHAPDATSAHTWNAASERARNAACKHACNAARVCAADARQTGGQFVTAFYGILNRKTLEFTYSNAGHNPPYIISKDQVEFLLNTYSGIPLAVMHSTDMPSIGKEYHERTLQLSPATKLLLYTDGLTEAVPESKSENPQKNDDFENNQLKAPIDGAVKAILPGIYSNPD